MLRLRELREENGYTQAYMATNLQISRQVYANYENEINQPSIEMLEKLANFFQCSVDYIIGRSDDFGNVAIKEKSPSSFLKPEEQELLNNFRSLPKTEQTQASEYVQYLADKRGKKKA